VSVACVAVIFAIPAPTIVIVSPATVATAVLELAYVNVPMLIDVGGTNVNAASPTVFVGIEKLDKSETPLPTVSVPVIVLEA